MRVLFVLAAIVCAFVAFVHAQSWHWLGIDPYVWDMYAWGYASLGCLSASFLPWGRPFRRWFGPEVVQ